MLAVVLVLRVHAIFDSGHEVLAHQQARDMKRLQIRLELLGLWV